MRWRLGRSADKQAQRFFISLFFSSSRQCPSVQVLDTEHTLACEPFSCCSLGADNGGDIFWHWDNGDIVVLLPDAPVFSLRQGQQHLRWARERGCHGRYSQSPCMGLVPSAFLTTCHAPTLLSWIASCFPSLVLFSVYSTETWLMHLVLGIRYLIFYKILLYCSSK